METGWSSVWPAKPDFKQEGAGSSQLSLLACPSLDPCMQWHLTVSKLKQKNELGDFLMRHRRSRHTYDAAAFLAVDHCSAPAEDRTSRAGATLGCEGRALQGTLQQHVSCLAVQHRAKCQLYSIASLCSLGQQIPMTWHTQLVNLT